MLCTLRCYFAFFALRFAFTKILFSFGGVFFSLFYQLVALRKLFPRLAHFTVNRPKNPIHEFPRGFAAKRLYEFYRFINRDFGRHLIIIPEKKFVKPEAQHRAVNRSEERR